MKRFPVILSILIWLCSCGSEPYEYVELTYSGGEPHLVKYYKTDKKEVLLKKIEYWENGQKRIEGKYKNGTRHGEWIAWYDNGNLWSKANYDEGIENGVKTVWHKNGQKYYEGPIVNDERTGTWKFWNKEGELVKEVDYDE